MFSKTNKTVEAAPDQMPELPKPLFDAVIHLWSQSGSEYVVTVHGNSMRPILRDGDRVRISPGSEGYKRGDIVAYQHNGKLITHRLISKGRSGGEIHYLLKGDNVPRCDPAIHPKMVLGRVTALKRSDKWVCLESPLWRSIGWIVAVVAMTRLFSFRLFRKFIHVPFPDK